MINVAFLFDPNNDWLRDFFPADLEGLSGFTIKLFVQPNEVRDFELVFVLGYTRVLPDEFISSNGLVLVVHESDLPRGKGFAPVQWQILEGSNEITVSLIKMAEKVDSGDIVAQTLMTLDGSELYAEIRQKQAQATYSLVCSFLADYPQFSARPQLGESTFYRKRLPKDGELDVDKTLRENFPLLRIGNNEHWPSFFYLNGVKYVLEIRKAQDE